VGDRHRELVVTEDVPESALGVFLEVRPRTILLSGGTTPQALYRRMAAAEDYPWRGTRAFFGDERCVPPEDDLSNLRMAGEALLSHVDAEAYPIDGDGCDADGYERLLRQLFGSHPLFDLAIYGLGPDGHTASLFPGQPQAREVDRWVVHVPVAGMDPFVSRVSLTLPVLSAARIGMFLVEGEEKRGALGRLMAGDDIPASKVSPRRLLVLADPAAAGREP
jgi:6-phosphogluconolactonase